MLSVSSGFSAVWSLQRTPCSLWCEDPVFSRMLRTPCSLGYKDPISLGMMSLWREWCWMAELLAWPFLQHLWKCRFGFRTGDTGQVDYPPCTNIDQPWDAFAYQGALETAWGCGSRAYTLQCPLDRGRGCSHSCGPVPHNPSPHFWCVELCRNVHVDKCTGNPTPQFLANLLGK